MPSALKRVYEGVALFSLLNVLVVGGGLVYLLGTGFLDTQRLQRIASAFREPETPVESDDETQPAEDGQPGTTVSSAEHPPLDTQIELEILRREASRIEDELRQRLALNNSILLRITTERENFRREREEAELQATEGNRRRETEGFEKQIAILSSVKAATALDHLLSYEDPDDAAQVLLAMESRKAKKIVEAARGRVEKEKMKEILKRLRDGVPKEPAAIAGAP